MKSTFRTAPAASTAILARFIIALAILTTFATAAGSLAAQSQSAIVNVVHAGGSDIEDPDIPGSGPGFDKNYSLIAFKFADGTATGKLMDRYSGGGGLGFFGSEPVP